MEEILLDILVLLNKKMCESAEALSTEPPGEAYQNASLETVEERGYQIGVNDTCVEVTEFIYNRYRMLLNPTDHCITNAEESQDELARGTE